jgi:uncharacterized protein (TIGR02246 family)
MVLALGATVVPSVADARGTIILPPVQHLQSDAEAIRALVEDSTRAWNAGDASAYAARFAIDVEFTDVTGLSSSGRNSFESRLDQLFKTIFRGSRLKQTVRKIRLLTSDVAVIEIETELTGYTGLPRGVKAWPDGVLRTRLQEVLVKVAGAWWVSGYHDVDAKVSNLET